VIDSVTETIALSIIMCERSAMVQLTSGGGAIVSLHGVEVKVGSRLLPKLLPFACRW
jgi:hypothetical protein